MRIVLNSAISGLLLLVGCSSDPTPTATITAEPAKKTSIIPTGAIPALVAYNAMYKVERAWAPDVETASLIGSDGGSVKGSEGKYPVWTAVFVSPAKQLAQTCIYSTVEEGRTLRGFNSAGTLRWAGATQDAAPFSSSDISVDSDVAWSTAAEKAKDWLNRNRGKEITTFALGHSARFPAPVWYIMWGTKASGYAAYVNASTGKIFGK